MIYYTDIPDDMQKWFDMFKLSFIKEKKEIIADMKEVISDINKTQKSNEINFLIYEFENLEIELIFCFLEWERYLIDYYKAEGIIYKPLYN